MLNSARAEQNLQYATNFIKTLAEKAPSTTHAYRGLQIGPLRINSGGLVVNLPETLVGLHRSASSAIRIQWDSMEELSDKFSDEVLLVDLIIFCFTVCQKRKSQRKVPWKGNIAAFISTTRQHLLNFLSDLHHKLCLDYIAINPGSVRTSQIPSRRLRRLSGSGSERQQDSQNSQEQQGGGSPLAGQLQVVAWNADDVDMEDGGEGREGPSSSTAATSTRMHVHQIWDFLQNITTSVSAQLLSSVREKENHGGAKRGTVVHWTRKLLNMYFDKCSTLFKDRKRIRVVTDGSTHSCKETMVTIFATEAGSACYGTIQRLSTLKFVTPFELSLEPEAEYACARREQERLASYRYLAALSHQLQLLTCKSQTPLTMESFRPPLEVGLLPLQPGDQRFVMHRDAVSIVSVQRRGCDRKSVVRLDFEDDIPILCLLSDQGPSCTAAAAWLKHDDYSCLVHFQWDGIHRMANDIKGSQSKEASHMVVKTMYCWGLNYRPFGSGGFYGQKNELLKAFMQAESWAPGIFTGS